MLLADLVATSAAVAATRSRLAKIAALADCLRRAEPGEVAIVVSYLSGELRQRRTGVGWAALRDLPPPAAGAVRSRSSRSTARSRRSRRRAEPARPPCGARRSRRCSRRATADGAALPRDARRWRAAPGGAGRHRHRCGRRRRRRRCRRPCAARRCSPATSRRSPRPRWRPGAAGLARFHLQVGRPVQPMLAKTAPSLEAALEVTGRGRDRVEARRRAHPGAPRRRRRRRVHAHARSRRPSGCPRSSRRCARCRCARVILDGEAIALRPDGRPRPFQETASRAASRGEPRRRCARRCR